MWKMLKGVAWRKINKYYFYYFSYNAIYISLISPLGYGSTCLLIIKDVGLLPLIYNDSFFITKNN